MAHVWDSATTRLMYLQGSRQDNREHDLNHCTEGYFSQTREILLKSPGTQISNVHHNTSLESSTMDTNTSPSTTLWHTTTGDPSKPTLLLLHGMFCSHVEFTPLIPFLKDHYHIILVDLPGHSKSRSPDLNTYRLPQTVDALAQLIQQVSLSGKAHVAGMSLGAFIGLGLARSHPEVVESLFASGAPPFEGKELYFASRPRLLWYVIAPPIRAPDFLRDKIARCMGEISVPGLRVAMRENLTMQLLKDAFGDCLSITLKEIGEIYGVRVAAVAGGKVDNVDVTRRMGMALREKDPTRGSQAFVVRKAYMVGTCSTQSFLPRGFGAGLRANRCRTNLKNWPKLQNLAF